MIPRFLIAPLLALLPASLAAATVQLTNGGFSTGTGSVATGWNFVNGGGTNSAPSNYAEVVPGSTWGRSLQLKSDGGNFVEQALALTDLGAMDATTFGSFTVGLDFGYRRDAVRNGDHTLRVSIWNLTDNVELAGSNLLISDPGSTGANSLAAASIALRYDNAAASLIGDSIVLRFTSTSSDLGTSAWQRTAMIDNVVVSAVPEPAGVLSGLICALGLLRRRRCSSVRDGL